MKGIILAGGLGSRLFPLTKVTNKHLLPIYNKPMIYYPVEKLVKAGIRDVMIVTGGTSSGEFMRLLGDGRHLGLKSLGFTYQEGEGGIAHALSLVEHFVKDGKFAVILGDNIFEDDLTPYVKQYERQKKGAMILLKEVEDAERFGVAEIRNQKIIRIVEKPKKPTSNYAVTGIYFYDGAVFNMIRKLKPSGRGELEITDVNNGYLKQSVLKFDVMRGYWTDAGTFESLFRANHLAQMQAMKSGR